MKWKRIKKTVRENPVYLKAGILAAAAVVCFVCVYMWDNSREIRTNENGEKILERDADGKDQTHGMKVRIGDKEEEMNISVSGRKYNEEELKKAIGEFRDSYKETLDAQQSKKERIAEMVNAQN